MHEIINPMDRQLLQVRFMRGSFVLAPDFGSALRNQIPGVFSNKARSCLNSMGHHGDRRFGIGRGKMSKHLERGN
jgi:hypothetical protein